MVFFERRDNVINCQIMLLIDTTNAVVDGMALIFSLNLNDLIIEPISRLISHNYFKISLYNDG